MSTITLQFVFEMDDVATDVVSAVLSDATGTYGVKRDDTDAVVVAAGTAMTRIATGTYEYSFTSPADGLEYTWWVEYVYPVGTTSREKGTYSDTTKVVTATEAKETLHVSGTDHDQRINLLIDAATQWAQKYLQRKFLTAACIDYLDQWPAQVIRPRWSPLLTVSSITYVDTAGATQTWDSGDYVVDVDAEPGEIRLAYEKTWPTIRGEPNEIIVSYTAGYGTAAADVPAHFRTALLLMIYDWFYHPDREGQMPAAVRSLLGIERMIGVG